jgi:hypothetical protein
MAGLSGPVLRDPPPQLNGVLPLPGKRDEGDVKAATLGNLVPPGVSTVLVAVPLPPVPNDCSNGFGSRLSWLGKYSPSPGFGGGARGRAGSLATPSALVAVAFLSLPALPLALSLRVLLSDDALVDGLGSDGWAMMTKVTKFWFYCVGGLGEEYDVTA